ncbi:MAG: cupin domain-containing protein [Betaproteobacteria bacterium]|nr:MAG: cupin domain-containing protein [Betaproteobacteria bacterium]
MHAELRAQLVEQGYAGPVRVLDEQSCRQIVDRLSDGEQEPVDWRKGHAVSSWAFFQIARQPAIIERVSSLLGDDVMLWGASVQIRTPDAVHPWHSDIEISTAWGKSVSVWIGLEHTEAHSSLSLISYSHRFGVTVQETAHRSGKRRREIGNEDVLRWATEHDPRSRVVNVEMTDGEALFLDGALWHGSHNFTPNTRKALLLQYAAPDLPIRIPDFSRLEWPVRVLESPRPPCIMVKGTARTGDNRIVSAPKAPAAHPARKLSNRVYPLRIPLAPDQEKGWRAYPIFRGSTATLRALTCHASVLTHGQCPHAPHRHDEEEILIVLSGEVDIEVPDLKGAPQNGRMRVTPGRFAYYPPRFAHTLRTVSEEPASYLMLKWQCAAGPGPPLGFGRYDAFAPVAPPTQEKGFRAQALFEGPTASLTKLHCHASTLLPGASYSPHVDAHDVAIVILEGELETLGERVKPCSVIFHPAGESHGMRNPGGSPARYVVFEFHGDRARATETPVTPEIVRARRLIDPRRWKSAIKQLLKVSV